MTEKPNVQPKILRPLTDEELAELPEPTDEEIDAALRQGWEDRKKCEPGMYARKGWFR